ncbi:MAG: hypothetical protein D3922_05275 [Candidatus Electrothrix sp. AR1]|nr:hypothetical protein [Candidatus Electrothrix sp. AR1]
MSGACCIAENISHKVSPFRELQTFLDFNNTQQDDHRIFILQKKGINNFGYQLKAGQPAKLGNCADHRKLFIAGFLPNAEASEPEFLSRLKLGLVAEFYGTQE